MKKFVKILFIFLFIFNFFINTYVNAETQDISINSEAAILIENKSRKYFIWKKLKRKTISCKHYKNNDCNFGNWKLWFKWKGYS